MRVNHERGIATLARMGPAPGAGDAASIGDARFHSTLRAAVSRENRAREAASQFVGTAFIQPILARMHDSPLMADRFKPGEGERRFRPMLDALVSDGIARAASFPLTEAVVSRLLGRPGGRIEAPHG